MSRNQVELAELYVYPLKSAAGIKLEHAKVGLRGLEFDRRWMLVDEDGQFISQRKHPRMALLKMSAEADAFRVDAEGMPPLLIKHALEEEQQRSVQIWSSNLKAWLYPAQYSKWFSQFLGMECQLVAMPDDGERIANPENTRSLTPIRFVDGYPILMISENSLVDLNSRLDTPVPMNRFRANFILRNCEAYAEDSWDQLTIGDLKLETIKRCPRCVVTTVDQATAEKAAEPLRTLGQYRRFGSGVDFGMYTRALNEGSVSVGMPLRF